MKKMIVLMLAMVFLFLNGMAFAIELPQAVKVKTHSYWVWFTLPEDEHYPLYILALGSGTLLNKPVTYNLTLKDWQFKPLYSYTYICNPGKDLYITLNDLWPTLFDYSSGWIDIIYYIIEVKVTEPMVDRYFYNSPTIYAACVDPDRCTDWELWDYPGYAEFLGITFYKLPPANLNK